MLILKVTQNNRFVKSYEFYKRKYISIGRWRNNDIVLNDPAVSGHHAEIESKVEEEYVIKDLNSANGTLVNGEKVGTQLLKGNDIITIGRCDIRFGYKYLEDKFDHIESQLHEKTEMIDINEMEKKLQE